MKKILMMLAIAACAVQAQALSSIVFRVRTEIVWEYRPTGPGGQMEAWATQPAQTCLAAIDDSTHRTRAHNASDTTWQGSSEPYWTAFKYGESSPDESRSYAIRKSDWSGAAYAEGILSSGYSVYLIQNTTYDDVVSELANGNYMGFTMDNTKWLVDETFNTGSLVYDRNLYYGYDGEKHLSIQFDKYASGESVLDAALDENKTTVAVMLYVNDDATAAQYLVSDYSGVIDGGNAWFYGNPEAEVGGIVKTTGWQDFTSVPEPTSGMLMLLGLAGLALKRKRA